MNEIHQQIHEEQPWDGKTGHGVKPAPANAGERRPVLPGWVEISTAVLAERLRAEGTHILGMSAWQKGRICCISGLEVATYPDRSGGAGPQWHLSVTLLRAHPPDSAVRIALAAFDLEAAEEDNHEPGNARHFWMPVDSAHRVDCECKADEQLIVESNGHRWTNPKNGPCRGCDLQRLTGKPCTLHGGQR